MIIPIQKEAQYMQLITPSILFNAELLFLVLSLDTDSLKGLISEDSVIK